MEAAMFADVINSNFFIRKILFVFCLSVLSGCSVPTRVKLFNASNSEVVIEYKNEKSLIVHTTLVNGHSREFTALLDKNFTIKSSDKKYLYQMSMVPEIFITHRGVGPFFKRVVKAQLHENKCIYLVSSDIDLPVNAFESQPEGFPLCPKILDQ
jgi:hypothetical protein